MKFIPEGQIVLPEQFGTGKVSILYIIKVKNLYILET